MMYRNQVYPVGSAGGPWEPSYLAMGKFGTQMIFRKATCRWVGMYRWRRGKEIIFSWYFRQWEEKNENRLDRGKTVDKPRTLSANNKWTGKKFNGLHFGTYWNKFIHKPVMAADPNCLFCGWDKETTTHILCHFGELSRARKRTLGMDFIEMAYNYVW